MKIVRVALALAVALWMAGAGCLLGCENMVSAAGPDHSAAHTNALAIVASGEACASMQSHDCCAARNAASGPKSASASSQKIENATGRVTAPEVSATTSPMMDCPLAVNATAVLSKPRLDQSTVVLLSRDAKLPVSHAIEQTIGFVRPLRPPNRGHTYLRCCVFLI